MIALCVAISFIGQLHVNWTSQEHGGTDVTPLSKRSSGGCFLVRLIRAGLQKLQKNKTTKSKDYIIFTKPFRGSFSINVQFILWGQDTLTLEIEGRRYYDTAGAVMSWLSTAAIYRRAPTLKRTLLELRRRSKAPWSQIRWQQESAFTQPRAGVKEH